MKKSIIAAAFLGLGLTQLANAEPEVAPAKIPQVKEQYKTDVVLTSDNTLDFRHEFFPDTVAAAIKKAREMDSKLPSKDPIYLVISSRGGSIEAGIELIRALNTLNRPVITLTVFAASMGFQTVQGVNGERLIVTDGTLMSHRASGGFEGQFPGQLDSRYTYYLKRVKRLDEKAVERTNGKQTDESYKTLIADEMWCEGQDCVNQGFADRVVTATCDSSLNGTVDNVLGQIMFSGHLIQLIETKNACPLSNSALAIKIYVDGQPLFKNVYELDKPHAVNTFGTSNEVNLLQIFTKDEVKELKVLINNKLEEIHTAEQSREVIKY